MNITLHPRPVRLAPCAVVAACAATLITAGASSAHAAPSTSPISPAILGGPATVAVSRVENGARVFYLAGSLVDGGGTVTRIAFGDADDVPVLVDRGDGSCLPAVYRNSDSSFYFASAPQDGGGSVDRLPFGNAGDQPVQNGQYNTDTVKVLELRRPSDATFYTQAQYSGGGSSLDVDPFGDPSDIGFEYADTPNAQTHAVYRSGNSTFYIESESFDPSDPVTTQQFGNQGDQPVVANWKGDADSTDRVGVFRASEGRWYLSNTVTDNSGDQAPAITDVYSFTFGSPGDTALACDGGGSGDN